MRSPRFGQRTLTTIGFVALLMVTPGCGNSNEGPARYPLSGSVTFGGKPVPRGEVALEPDESKGNKGPAVIAPIQDGRFETPLEKGTVGGPHLVRIIGTDGQPYTMTGGMVIPEGKQLFPPFNTTLDVPKEEGTHDFEVPAATQ